MIPSHAAVYLQLSLVFIVHVHARHLGRCEAGAPTAEHSPPAAEAHIVDIVEIAESHHTPVAFEVGPHQLVRIAALAADSQVDVGEHAFVHAFFQTEVQNSLLIAVVNTGDACEITLLVVGLDILHDTRRQIL